MSLQLINRSPDLKQLRDEGFDIEIRAGYLLVMDVPYVNQAKLVKRGTLVSELSLAGDTTTTPGTHVAMFMGEYPCDKDGVELAKIKHSGGRRLAEDLEVNFQFSSKPVGTGKYEDYYHKVTAYLAVIISHAQAIRPEVRAKTFPVIPTEDDESVFKYLDTATSRARIGVPAKKLELDRIAIVGVGGTGSYVLDLVAKTMVKEIHLFDGDTFLSHNAFRSPGAASVEELREKLKKVEYLARLYSKMRRGIHPHDYALTAENASELDGMNFVFLCMATGDAKRSVVEQLEERDIPFIDVGMGVDLVDDESLHGQLRVSTNTSESRESFRKRAPLGDPGVVGEYEQNIQIADLNALNAALAVVKWKKLFGFYLDLEKEHNTTYVVNTNEIINDDHS